MPANVHHFFNDVHYVSKHDLTVLHMRQWLLWAQARHMRTCLAEQGQQGSELPFDGLATQ